MKRVTLKRGNQRGAVLAMLAGGIIILFLLAGVAVDIGTAYVRTMSLSKAVDAGALAGAKYTMKGEAEMRTIIDKVAAANFGPDPDSDYGATYDVTIWSPATDTTRVRVHGTTASPAMFSRVVGQDDIPISVLAEATRYPLDMSLSLDLSASLDRNEAFDDMQLSAKNFLDYFDDNIDQFGIVTYSTWAAQQMPVQKNFKVAGKAIIDGLNFISDTNIEEGLRLSKSQLDVAFPRQEAMKIVVLFTDGRATAFAENLEMPSGHNPAWYNGVWAAYISGTSYRGTFQSNDGQKIKNWVSGAPVLYPNSSSTSSQKPKNLPGGLTVNGTNVRSVAAAQTEAQANTIRAGGYTIFVVALGDPDATDPGDVPDLDLLTRVANEDGIVSSSQPKGEMLFAPSPEELDQTFALLADRIITRLTR
jgi:Flp pilus assembly protein TadG